MLAIADPRDQHGRPDPLHTRLEIGGLKTVGDADLHALPALDASLQKFPFFQRPRRADEPGVHVPGL